MNFSEIAKRFVEDLKKNQKKNSKAQEKNFLTIVKSHLEVDCDGCQMLEKEEEFEVKTIHDKVQPLLVEFTDIKPFEMSDGLLFL